MDPLRREEIDASIGDKLNGPDQRLPVSGDTLSPTDTRLASDLIDSIALEAIAVLPELKLAGGLQQSGSGNCLDETDPIDPTRVTQIGPYEVSARIGGGHVGSVYRATCYGVDPRQLAIKLMRHTVNKDTILRRFRSEIHIQAAMAKHPNITALSEAGATEDGRPYFTMDYIEGQPIDEYCDARQLDMPSRLALFIQVCGAIHFAHQHAVIHRNLNPSNILVTADGVPKVLDLGIAKLVQPNASCENNTTGINATLTGTGELVLSSEYASPEQIKGEAVTTASDVYALGVVLYRLLSGCWPYRITSQSRSDILQAICEQLPARPSVAIASLLGDEPKASVGSPVSLSKAPTELAMARGVPPQQLRKILSGDLDSIVLKALQKEPEQRYASVKHLGEDLSSYLRGTPVHARRDFPAYRPGKFIQRHAIAIAAGLLSLLLILTGLLALTRSLLTARRERDRTEKSFRQAHQVLDQMSTRIANERSLDQEVMRPVRSALLMDARRFYEDLLSLPLTDPDHGAERAMAQTRLARIISQTESPVKGIAPYRRAIALWEKLVLQQSDNLEYQANLAQTLNDLGVMLSPLEDQADNALNALHQAQTIVERLISAEPESVSHRLQLSQIILNTAKIEGRQGKLDEAITSIERVLQIQSQVVADYPGWLEPRVELATAHAVLGDLLAQKPAESLTAIASYQQAIELHETLARQHPELVDQSDQLATELSKLGGIQQQLGQLEPAVQYLRRAIEVFERISALYPDIVPYREGLGLAYHTMSDLERTRGEESEALEFAQKARKLFEQLIADNPKNDSWRRDLAQSYTSLGRLQAQTADSATALRSFQRSVDLLESLHELNAKDSYKLACNIALCIPLISRKTLIQGVSQEPSKGDRLRCQLYGDRAIESLRRSFKGGFLNSQILEDATDLDSLRSRTDFKTLVRELDETPTSTGR